MAKTLYLVRHAKSDWHNHLSDFARPLNNCGKRDAPEMGERLKKKGAVPELVVCSPAERALQTMKLLDLGKEPIFNENIYEAPVDSLLEVVQSLDDRFGSAMLIGHNPGMSMLIGYLCGKPVGQMPPCSVATIHIASSHWKDAGFVAGQLLDFDHPRESS